VIKHISMAKYKQSADGNSKEENIKKAKSMTEALKKHIPQIKKIEVGVNILNNPTDFDVVSCSEYDNMDDVRKTVAHPAHDELIAFLKKVTEVSHAVTYEVP
jgi:spore coat polysaccharide biosynthesis protein SpsF (cytidylyltransferase family)